MAAEKGNQYWFLRKKVGRNKKYTPRTLQKQCEEYFKWATENPLFENKVITFEGFGTDHPSPLQRVFTIKAMCLYLGIDETTWRDYRKQEVFSPVCQWAEDVIYTQKFEGAAAGLLNPSIIARDLGLAEQKKVEGKLTLEELVCGTGKTE